jgi:hypothetical protein
MLNRPKKFEPLVEEMELQTHSQFRIQRTEGSRIDKNNRLGPDGKFDERFEESNKNRASNGVGRARRQLFAIRLKQLNNASQTSETINRE